MEERFTLRQQRLHTLGLMIRQVRQLETRTEPS